jgi:hypothetical protein
MGALGYFKKNSGLLNAPDSKGKSLLLETEMPMLSMLECSELMKHVTSKTTSG